MPTKTYKTKEELREEFINHLKKVGLNIVGETENLYRGVADYWLAQREEELKELQEEIEKRMREEKSANPADEIEKIDERAYIYACNDIISIITNRLKSK